VKLVLGSGKEGLIMGEAEDCIIDGFGMCVVFGHDERNESTK